MTTIPPAPLLWQNKLALDYTHSQIAYVGYEGTIFHLSGPFAPVLGAQSGVVLKQLANLDANFKHLDNKGARQDGTTWFDSLYDPGEIAMQVTLGGTSASDMRHVISSWWGAWDPRQVGKLCWFSPERGEWVANVRMAKPVVDKFTHDWYQSQEVTFTWVARNDNAFWQGVDSVSQFGNSQSVLNDSFTTVEPTGLDSNWTQANSGGGYVAQPATVLPPPSNLQADPNLYGTGGNLVGGTYFWVVTALNDAGETIGSNGATALLESDSDSVALTWNPVPGATGYNVYRGEASGGTPVTVDTGASGVSGVNTGGPASQLAASTTFTRGASGNYVVALVPYLAGVAASEITCVYGSQSGGPNVDMTLLGSWASGYSGIAIFGLATPPSGAQTVTATVTSIGEVAEVGVCCASFKGWGSTVFQPSLGGWYSSPSQVIPAVYGELAVWGVANTAGTGITAGLGDFNQALLQFSLNDSVPSLADSMSFMLGYGAPATGEQSVYFSANASTPNIDQFWTAVGLTLLPAEPPISTLVATVDTNSYIDTGVLGTAGTPPGSSTAAAGADGASWVASGTTTGTAICQFTGSGGVSQSDDQYISVTFDEAMPSGQNAVQTVTVNATGGTFTLSFQGQTTLPIAYGSNALTVQENLVLLSTIGVSPTTFEGNVVVTGAPSSYTVEFINQLGSQPQPLMTYQANSLTGGSGTMNVSTTTAGYGVYVDLWGRMNNTGTLGNYGVRARIGYESSTLSIFNNGTEHDLWSGYTPTPAAGDTWSLQCGVNSPYQALLEETFLLPNWTPNQYQLYQNGNPLLPNESAAESNALWGLDFGIIDTNDYAAVGPLYRGEGFGMVAPGTGSGQIVPPSLSSFVGGQGSGFMTLANTGDQPGWPRYLVYGPGTFLIGDIGTNSLISFGPLQAGQVALLNTMPRLAPVVDLTPAGAVQSTVNQSQQLIETLVNYATNNNVPPLLQEWESYFGIQPPQGPLTALLSGRFTQPLPPMLEQEGPQTTHIYCQIQGGNNQSKVVAAVTPYRRWPE